jgi:hypothetical protein
MRCLPAYILSFPRGTRLPRTSRRRRIPLPRRNGLAGLLAIVCFASSCTGLSYALHIQAEGPEHEYEADDCPVCHQLRAGWTAASEEMPAPVQCAELVEILRPVPAQAPCPSTANASFVPRGPPSPEL